MKMYKGQFVFIKDDFLSKYFPPVIGKDGKSNYINHDKGRPFFYVFDETDDIAWVVPVSSDKTGKYHKKYEFYKNHETKEIPNWFAVGNVDDIDCSFNLSMMFPVPKSEIDHVYYSRKYHYFPIRKLEGIKIINLAVNYKKINDANIKKGFEEIIKSPYKEILKDLGLDKEKAFDEININDDIEV